jgi:hypothetical protein
MVQYTAGVVHVPTARGAMQRWRGARAHPLVGQKQPVALLSSVVKTMRITRFRAVGLLAAIAACVALAAIALVVRPRQVVPAKPDNPPPQRVSEVTAIACAIERYRARHGRLPSAAEFRQSEPQLMPLVDQELVKVVLLPPNYIVEELGLGFDVQDTWRVLDGRWDVWPSDTPAKAIHDSELAILRARQAQR